MQEVQSGQEMLDKKAGYLPGAFSVKEDRKDSFQSILQRYEKGKANDSNYINKINNANDWCADSRTCL